MPCSGVLSFPPAVFRFFAKMFGGIHHSLVLSTSILMWEFPGCFPISGNASVSYFLLICWSPWPSRHAKSYFFPGLLKTLGRKKKQVPQQVQAFLPASFIPKGFYRSGRAVPQQGPGLLFSPAGFQALLARLPWCSFKHMSSHAIWTQYPHSYGLQDPAEESAGRRSNMEGTEDRGAAVVVCVWNRKMNTREETG